MDLKAANKFVSEHGVKVPMPFVPCSPSCAVVRACKRAGASYVAIALGSSYMQRLCLTTKAASELTHLGRIRFSDSHDDHRTARVVYATCIGIASKIVQCRDAYVPPLTALVAAALGTETFSREDAEAFEMHCLTWLEWKLLEPDL